MNEIIKIQPGSAIAPQYHADHMKVVLLFNSMERRMVKKNILMM